MNKKNVMAIVIIVILAVCGVTYGVVHHKNEVQAQQKQEALIKKERESFKSANSAVDQAYNTRDSKDIEAANKAIDKLSNNQKEDKKNLAERLNTLDSLLKQLAEINIAIEKANKSKTEADVKSAQSLLDKTTDDYLKNDKKTLQNKLDTLKKLIAEEAKKKAEAKAKDEAVAVAKTQQEQQAADQEAQNNQTSNQEAYQEPPKPEYQEPTYQEPTYQTPAEQPNYQAPSQSAPAQPAPSQPSGGGGKPLPSGPVFGGGSNGAGIENSPGGNDGIGDFGPWQ